jgi:hypothetical protein
MRTLTDTTTSIFDAPPAPLAPAQTAVHGGPTLLTDAESEWVAAAGGKAGASTNPVGD